MSLGRTVRRTRCLAGSKPVKVHSAEEHFLARLPATPRLWRGCLLARLFSPIALATLWSRLPSAASLSGISLGSQRTRFFRYPPEPRCYGACRLSAAALAPVALTRSSQQVSSMRHAVDEVYDEFVAAETDKSVPRAISTLPVTPARPFIGIPRSPMRR